MAKIGIADTTFSNVDMAKIAIDILNNESKEHDIVRYTVPGIKDLPVACKKLFSDAKCDIVLALGMVGKEEVDKTCGHEASLGHQMVQTTEGKHIVEAFIHMDEANDDNDLFNVIKNRVSKHAINVLELLKGPNTLQHIAGHGLRQGRDDVGQIKEHKK